MFSCKLHAPACALATALAVVVLDTPAAAQAPPRSQADASSDVPRPLDARAAVRIATERSSVDAAARAGARAARAMGDADGSLPDPEVMAEAWQVPLSRPHAFGDASMISVFVRQTFPAPGVRSSRASARDAEARAVEATGRDRLRSVARDAGHAFVDLQSAEARRLSHVVHRDVATRLVVLARARLATAGGRLVDVAEAEVERARLDADVAVESTLVGRARARLNALLRRPLDAPIEPVPLGPPEIVALDVERAVAFAATNRPELASIRARREADDASREAAAREAKIPSFTVGAGWFAPTTTMPFHGYGLSLGATLPWLWGGARARARASAASADATSHDATELRAQVRAEVASLVAEARAAAVRVAVLGARAKPAADAALEIALSAYQSGQGNAAMLFRAEKDLVEIDVALVDARTMLAHALVDLDWATGSALPRAPLDTAAVARDAAAEHDRDHAAGGAP